MYTEQLTQALGFAAAAGPQQLTATTTINTGKIDMRIFRRALFAFASGTFGGTSPTLSAALQMQESPDGTTWSNNATVPAGSIAAQGQIGTVEIKAGQLGAGMRYVRLQAVCTVGGTSPTIPVATIGFGGEARFKPGSQQNDPSVANQTVVT